MKEYPRKLVRLLAGLAVMAVGIAMAYQAALGLAPWDVLHDGIAQLLRVTFGQAGIIVGAAVVVIDLIYKERLGVGTILNVLIISWIIDLILYTGVIPSFVHCEGLEQLVPRLALCVGAIFFQSFGMYLYMSAGLGGGPRDSLMCALARRAKKMGVGGVRLITEALVFVAGWLLGGRIGLGSILLVTLGGPIMALIFKAFQFDVKTLKHKSFFDTARDISAATRGRKPKPGA